MSYSFGPLVLFAGRHEIGDGELNRMLRDLQRKHFRPPATTTANV